MRVTEVLQLVTDLAELMHPGKEGEEERNNLINAFMEIYFRDYKDVDIETIRGNIPEILEKAKEIDEGKKEHIRSLEPEPKKRKRRAKRPNEALPQTQFITNTRADKKILDGSAYVNSIDEIDNNVFHEYTIDNVKCDLFCLGLWTDEAFNDMTSIKLGLEGMQLFFIMSAFVYRDGDNITIKVEDLYRHYTGNENARLTGKNKIEFVKIIDKIGATRIHIETPDGFYYRGPLLTLELLIDETTPSKNELSDCSLVRLHKLKSFMGEGVPLIEYAKKRNKLLFYPPKLLDVRDVTTRGKITDKRMRNDNMSLKLYLRQRVIQIKGSTKEDRKKKGWDTILYSAIKERYNIPDYNDSRYRKYITKILRYWKFLPIGKDGKERFIKDFKEFKENGKWKYRIIIEPIKKDKE